ncbi:C-X-C chemokine receptor type 3-like, partial [Chanos chanos]|uniref:C-X-C chemokine receptor type 3 n=1 Tax=Chanos chanos TaxID=29144 RepID=A0A6J2W7U2_CHACN
ELVSRGQVVCNLLTAAPPPAAAAPRAEVEEIDSSPECESSGELFQSENAFCNFNLDELIHLQTHSIEDKQTFEADEIFGDLNDSYFDSNYSYDYGGCCQKGLVCDQQNIIQFEAIFTPILYSLALVLGLPGNSLVLAILWQKKRSWSVTDAFIMHLGVADTLLLLTLPFWAIQAAEEWVFGTGFCKVCGALFQINFYCGIFLLACISLDRYLSIVHAVQMYSRRKPRVVQSSCVAVWLFSFFLSIPDWLYLQAQRDSRRKDRLECTYNYPAPEWRQASRLLYHVVGFLLPAVIMLFCYSCILLRLQRGSQGLQKQRAVRVILAVVLAFFICWTPYNITLMVDTFHSNGSSPNRQGSCDGTEALDVSLAFTYTLGLLHCCLNPILYAFVGVKFRRHLVDILRSLGCRLKGRAVPVSRKSSVWSESVDTSHTSAF